MNGRAEQKNEDAAKFLELLLSDCKGGTGDHAWRKCRRCLAMGELETRSKLAREFLQAAIVALRELR